MQVIQLQTTNNRPPKKQYYKLKHFVKIKELWNLRNYVTASHNEISKHFIKIVNFKNK